VLNVFTSVIDILKNILVGIFVSIYVLLSKERLAAGAKRVIMAVFKKDSAEQLLEYTHIANVKFGGYVMGNMLDCVMIGCIGFIVFTIFGIPYASLISFIIGVTNFIPFFGPFIGGIPSAIIILIADPSKVILFLIIIVVMQQIDGNLIQPKIIGDKTGLSSLGVIFAITLMGGIFGFIGLVIGAPTIALLSVIINDKIEHRLSANSLSRDIGDYYNDDDLIKPDDIPNEHLVNRIWDKIKTKISDRKNKNDKK
jgi:predicted PurR-regulated permease PerM